MAGETFTGTPEYYSDMIRELMERAFEKANEPRYEYENPRVAAPTWEQSQIRNNYRDYFLSKENNPLSIAAPYLKYADRASYQDVHLYANPYEKMVVDNIRNQDADSFINKVVPKINGNFLSAGAYNTGKRQTFMERALKDANKDTLDKIADVRMNMYKQASDASNKDLDRSALLADLSSNIANTSTTNYLARGEAAGNAAGQDRAYRQSLLNDEYERWADKQNYPTQQLDRLNTYLRGLPNQQSYSYQSNPIDVPDTGNSAAQGAGILGQLLYMRNNGGKGRVFKKGGRVTRAMGGALQQQQPSQYEQSLQAAANQLAQSDHNPMWEYFGQAAANLAGSRNPNLMGALGEASQAGFQGFQNAKAMNDARKMKHLEIQRLIEESRRMNEKELFERQKYAEDSSLDKQYKLGTLDIHRQQLAETNRHNQALEYTKLKELYDKALDNPNKSLLNKTAEKNYEKIVEEGDAAAKRSQIWSQMEKLLPKLGWTEIGGKEIYKPLKGFFGDRAAQEEFDSLSKLALVDVTSIIKGAQSDRDMRNWEKTIPSLSTSPEGKALIIRSRAAIDKRAEQNAQFITDALEKGVSLNDAKKTFKTWANNNPLFSEDGLSINPPPQDSPENYLTGGNPSIEPSSEEQTTPPAYLQPIALSNDDIASMTPEQKEQRRNYLLQLKSQGAQ